LYDALIPVTYKYNDGTSGRIHAGYIAQDVLTAMEKAGLTTTEFAGYVKAIETDRETEKETEVCCLRYEEFIAINTDQIQKLKRRVSESEAEINSLKIEILNLRNQLENLTSS
jgi:predicted RNase H-like nuclease (RuvC/YqgF family)